MIFGSHQNWAGNVSPFRPWFAWRPVHLIDGRWAWLERIECGGYYRPEVPVHAPFNVFTEWCYRAPSEK